MSKEMIKIKFSDVFKGLGNTPYHITLKDDAVPVIHPARRVPHSSLDKLKQCLDVNLQCGVIKKVNQPTGWVHSLVIVNKNGTLRLYLDPRDLNEVAKREHNRIKKFQAILVARRSFS